jgi:hypothetical protein
VASSRYYTGICLEGVRKITKNLRVASIPAEIRTEHLPIPLHQTTRFISLYACTLLHENRSFSYTINSVERRISDIMISHRVAQGLSRVWPPVLAKMLIGDL